MLLRQSPGGQIRFPSGQVGRWYDESRFCRGWGRGLPPATPTCNSVSGRQHKPLKLILRAVDIPEPFQRIRAQSETEARPVRRMHHAVRAYVEWLVEELPHH